MTFNSPKPQSNKVLVPQGTHMARCISLIQLGLQKNDFQEGELIEKLWLVFELPEEKYVFKEGDEARPFTISKEYSNSMGMKSNLRPIIEGIIGTHLSDEEAYAFDLEELIGRACLLTVEQGETKNGTISSWIKSTASLMKGMVVPEAYNPTTLLTFEKWNKEIFDKLPDFLKNRIKESKQYKDKFIRSDGGDNNEVPF